MSLETLCSRRKALRLPVKELAAKAGQDEDNVHRVLKGVTDPRQSTVTALDDALRHEERRMHNYLCELLGDEAAQ